LDQVQVAEQSARIEAMVTDWSARTEEPAATSLTDGPGVPPVAIIDAPISAKHRSFRHHRRVGDVAWAIIAFFRLVSRSSGLVRHRRDLHLRHRFRSMPLIEMKIVKPSR
jgi:hypothetical protein